MELNFENGEWTVGPPLAGADESGYGSVYEATGPDGVLAVAKFVPKAPGADREVLIADSLDAAGHVNVMPILDHGETEDSIVLIMPRAEKSLSAHLRENAGRLEPRDVVIVATDIARALASISHIVVHRDIKPGNVLLYNGAWHITDFGISRYANAATDAATRKWSLSPPFAAPEQWRLDRATSATDMYAFGVLLYMLVSGELPFRGPGLEDYREQHLEVPPPRADHAPVRLRSLIEECMSKASDARPTAANALARLGRILETPTRPGVAQLARFNQAVVARQHAEFVEQTKMQVDEERRRAMFQTAVGMFRDIWEPIQDAVETDASAATVVSQPTGGNALAISFEGALLTVTRPVLAGADQRLPFDVIGTSSISVRRSARARDEWLGRSHSLWFADAHVAGQYQWFEAAFMNHAWGTQPDIVPFSLNVDRAAGLFDGSMPLQMAWPFEDIDRDEPWEFVDRWVGWFAQAASAALQRPSSLPERPDAQNSWRRR